jgi:spore germination cell wall hydrolase CwlJ-like protein
MRIRLPRAGAFAPAAILLCALFGEPTAALAQDLAPTAAVADIVEAVAPAVVVEAAQAVEATLEQRVTQATSLQELVGDMPIEDQLAPDMKCLAQAVYFEARGEPLDGQLAVAKVVMNRATSGLYPRDYCAVITQRAQFSFVRRGVIPQADETSAAWRRAKAIARIAQQDLWASEARDALYFHANYVNPSWARRKTQLARIDTHIFYR